MGEIDLTSFVLARRRQRWCAVFTAVVLSSATPLVAQWPGPVRRYPAVYEYQYEFNTPDLNENHYIVLDSVAGRLRGWYYGTSDEFDQAREGYLPGFFVAEMQDLAVSDSRITFSLRRPADFFKRAVPLEYRVATDVPAKTLERWSVWLPDRVVTYSGSMTPERITLQLVRGSRVFQRRAGPTS